MSTPNGALLPTIVVRRPFTPDELELVYGAPLAQSAAARYAIAPAPVPVPPAFLPVYGIDDDAPAGHAIDTAPIRTAILRRYGLAR